MKIKFLYTGHRSILSCLTNDLCPNFIKNIVGTGNVLVPQRKRVVFLYG